MRTLVALSLVASLGAVAYAEDKGVLPEDAPEMMVLKSSCQVCHTLQYVTQQRLTEPQWKKTIEKMVKFGAPVQPPDVPRLIAFLAGRLTTELPDPPLVRVALPAGAVPPKKGRAHK